MIVDIYQKSLGLHKKLKGKIALTSTFQGWLPS